MRRIVSSSRLFFLIARIVAILLGLGGALPLAAQNYPPVLDQHVSFIGGYVGVGVFGEKVFAATESGVFQYEIGTLEDGPEASYGAGGGTRDYGARDLTSGFFVQGDELNRLNLLNSRGAGIQSDSVLAVTSSTPSNHFGILTTQGTITWRQADFSVINTFDVPSEILGFFDGGITGMGCFAHTPEIVTFMITGLDRFGQFSGRQFTANVATGETLQIEPNEFHPGANNDGWTDVDFSYSVDEFGNLSGPVEAFWARDVGPIAAIRKTDHTPYIPILATALPQEVAFVDWTSVLSVPSMGNGVQRGIEFEERSGSTCFYRLAVSLPVPPNP